MNRVNPRVDLIFKKLFGVEENKDLLISLINSIVSEEDQVVDLVLLNPYNPQNFLHDKLSILDIKAQGKDGKRFNIEMQITDSADYDKRALYYWAKLYTEQLKSGEDYEQLNKAIGIHILNFLSINGTDKYHNCFHITERDSGLRYFKDLELHTIELKKFAASESKEINELVANIKSSLDMWVAFLTKHDLLNKDQLPAELTAKPIHKALSALELMNLNETERYAYEDHLKWLRDEASTIKKAVSGAKEEGIAIGEARGEEKSILKVARRMLQENTDVKFISSVTGLSTDEILKLKNKL